MVEPAAVALFDRLSPPAIVVIPCRCECMVASGYDYGPYWDVRSDIEWPLAFVRNDCYCNSHLSSAQRTTSRSVNESSGTYRARSPAGPLAICDYIFLFYGCVSSGSEVVAITTTKSTVTNPYDVHREGLELVVNHYTKPGQRRGIWLSYPCTELSWW